MRTVIIYAVTDEADLVEIGRAVLLPDGRAELRGLEKQIGLRQQLEHGLYPRQVGQPRVMLADGAAFLDGLPYELSGSRVRAKECST